MANLTKNRAATLAIVTANAPIGGPSDIVQASNGKIGDKRADRDLAWLVDAGHVVITPDGFVPAVAVTVATPIGDDAPAAATTAKRAAKRAALTDDQRAERDAARAAAKSERAAKRAAERAERKAERRRARMARYEIAPGDALHTTGATHIKSGDWTFTATVGPDGGIDNVTANGTPLGSFNSLTAAARACVAHARPDMVTNVSGPSFWQLIDPTKSSWHATEKQRVLRVTFDDFRDAGAVRTAIDGAVARMDDTATASAVVMTAMSDWLNANGMDDLAGAMNAAIAYTAADNDRRAARRAAVADRGTADTPADA